MLEQIALQKAFEKFASKQVLTRFAPSPTGYLHLGHLASLLWVQAIANLFKAHSYLRIEDHDQTRSRPDYLHAICEDLTKIGARFDGGIRSIEDFQKSTYLQSNNKNHYRKLAHILVENKLAYWCHCSRNEIKSRVFREQTKHTELRYDGHCRNKNYGPESATLRLKTIDRTFVFDDLFQGKIEENPGLLFGDFSIWDRNDQPTYQFACVIDDLDQNMNLIIRGEDLLSSTTRQIYLRETLIGLGLYETNCLTAEVYGHHPLLLNAKKQKLSKRQFSESIQEMLNGGFKAEELVQQALTHLGIEAKSNSYQEAICAISSLIQR